VERTETRIGRVLVERARERARKEGREESELIEDALRSYLREADESRQPSMSESIPELFEEEAMKIAVEEQHVHKRGE